MIEIKNLTKRFGGLTAVDKLSLKVKKGEIYGLIGPNGAGKTTTLKLIVGLLRPTSGQILVGGFDNQKDSLQAKSLTGYIPDDPTAYESLSGREFLNFIGSLFGMKKAEREEKIKNLLPVFNLEGVADGYFGEYSRGNKQKFVILSALMHNPKYLIIDEPVVGLDPKSALQAKVLFSDFAGRGGTILVCSHTLSYLEDLCHRIGIIKDGKLISEGTLRELSRKAKGKTLEEMYLRITG